MPKKTAKTTCQHLYNAGMSEFPAPYACKPEKSRGRLHKEAESQGRSPYQRDRDRIIHSTAFRRLEYKTQVFVYHEGDHYRTRLTHSLEVAQLSRSIARELGLNEDLAEAVALAHDLGHPPFGHAGEEALQEVMAEFGGFDHNAQTIRVLTNLERKYAEFDGLNLTWECLEGVAKHNGPIKDKKPRAMAEYAKKHDLEFHTHAGLEAQVASLADDIAYNNHDIEDGLRAGLFKINDLLDLPLAGDFFKEVMKKYPAIEEGRLIHEAKRRLINTMVKDLVTQTRENIKKGNIQTAEDARNMGKKTAVMSESMEKKYRVIKEFLYQNMYKHYKVNRMTSKARRVVRELFTFFQNEPECLPSSWREKARGKTEQKRAEIVADFIAGMTDRFALEEHRKIFDTSYKLIGS